MRSAHSGARTTWELGMEINRVSVTYIKEEGAKPDCQLTERDDELDELLGLHIGRLKERARTDASLPCHFVDPVSVNRERLEHLAADEDEGFLEAARMLALNIQVGMKGNSKEGLFVAINGSEQPLGGENVRFAAILKLEVVDPVAGYMREVQEDRRLATVKQLLVRPKELQKGAYYPDPRGDSDLVVGDTMDKAALYFLRGLGLTQEMAPADAVAFLTKKVVQHFPLVPEDEVLQRLERSRARRAEDFVSENADLLRSLEGRNALLADLAAQARPVRGINPTAPAVTRRELVAGPFRLSFPPSARTQVTIRQRPDDRQWETIIVTPDEPRFR
jgi:hypothetical protein